MSRILNTEFENLQQGDLNKLAKLGVSGEISQYFGVESNKEPLDGDLEREFNVTGQLESGIVEGGQQFSVNIKVDDIEDKNGLWQPVWRLSQIVVQGQNISDELVVPAYIPRRYTGGNDISKLATYEHYVANAFAFTLPDLKQIIVPEFSTADNLVGLLHENGHNVVMPGFSEVELHNISKYREMLKIISSSSDPEGLIRDMREDGIKRGYLSKVRAIACLDYRWERFANEYVLKYFLNHQDVEWFRTDPEMYRLRKELSTASLTYRRMANMLIGYGTIAEFEVEY